MQKQISQRKEIKKQYKKIFSFVLSRRVVPHILSILSIYIFFYNIDCV